MQQESQGGKPIHTEPTGPISLCVCFLLSLYSRHVGVNAITCFWLFLKYCSYQHPICNYHLETLKVRCCNISKVSLGITHNYIFDSSAPHSLSPMPAFRANAESNVLCIRQKVMPQVHLVLTCDQYPRYFAFTPGVNKRSCYLSSAHSVRSQYANWLGRAGRLVSKHGTSQVKKSNAMDGCFSFLYKFYSAL